MRLLLSLKTSPQAPIGRTFKYKFSLPNFSDLTKPKVQKVYQNPIYKALEWQKMLDKGQFKSKAELGRHFGVSRVRVVQIVDLLKLSPEVINKVTVLGETFNKKIIGEKTLRPLINLSPAEQIEKLSGILSFGSLKK